MNAADRLALERELREQGHVAGLQGAALHNVRLHVGTTEIYGREDWAELETRRFASWGSRSVSEDASVEGAWGSTVRLIALRWRLGSGAQAPEVACLTAVHAGRIVREWQYYASHDLPAVSETRPRPLRAGIPWEYGEVRASLGQVAATCDARDTAPRAIASHPVVEYWHRRWNLQQGETASRCAPLSDPVMMCERLVCSIDGREAALQWRLVGRLVAPGWGLQPNGARVELPGLAFFALDGGAVTEVSDHPHFAALEAQLAARAES